MPTRVLGAVRLSNLTDESTSPARQVESIDWWSGGNEGTVVATVQDLSVSGAVSPFERDQLGPWLTDEKAGQWDVLVAKKLDRISRSAEDTLRLLNWCIARSKRIVCVDDGIDTSTQMGRVWIQLAAIFAEVERINIKERVLDSRNKLRREGRWSGGPPVYGLMISRRTNGAGYELAHDPDAYPHARFIVESFLAGKTRNGTAEHLNEQNVPTPQDLRRIQLGKSPRGGKWRNSTVNSILSSRSLLGQISHNGEVVRGPDGLPVSVGESVVTLDEWKRIQAKLADDTLPRTRVKGASPLLGVAFCGVCRQKLYRQSAVRRGKLYEYYRCEGASGNPSAKKCATVSMPAQLLEDFTEEQLLDEIGDREVTEQVLVPGEDHTAELAGVQMALEELTALAGSAKSATGRKKFREQMETLDSRLAELEEMPQRSDEWQTVGTGRTWRQRWESSNKDEQRDLLVRAGIRVEAKYPPAGFSFVVPEDLRERIAQSG